MDVDVNQNTIGGGAINEKIRHYQQGNREIHNNNGGGNDTSGSWDPQHNVSHMLHALAGLDRYPNYLSRFKDTSDMDLLETALEARLLDVRKQKLEIAERRSGIKQLVKRYIASSSMVLIRSN